MSSPTSPTSPSSPTKTDLGSLDEKGSEHHDEFVKDTASLEASLDPAAVKRLVWKLE